MTGAFLYAKESGKRTLRAPHHAPTIKKYRIVHRCDIF